MSQLIDSEPDHRVGHYSAYDAPAEVRPVVDKVWLHARPDPPRPGVAAVVLPDPGLSLCFACRRGPDGDVQEGRLLLIGPVLHPRRYLPPAGERMEAIRFDPEWSRALLGVVPDDHLDALDDLVEVRADLARPLLVALHDSRCAEEAVRILLDFVRERIRDWAPDGAALLAHRALQRIRQDARPGRIAPVAEEVGVSPRHLRRVVTEITGVSPRTYARQARCVGVMCAADALERPSWVDLAAAHGFADQAHMCREVRRVTGMPPGRLYAARWSEA